MNCNFRSKREYRIYKDYRLSLIFNAQILLYIETIEKKRQFDSANQTILILKVKLSNFFKCKFKKIVLSFSSYRLIILEMLQIIGNEKLLYIINVETNVDHYSSNETIIYFKSNYF